MRTPIYGVLLHIKITCSKVKRLRGEDAISEISWECYLKMSLKGYLNLLRLWPDTRTQRGKQIKLASEGTAAFYFDQLVPSVSTMGKSSHLINEQIAAL